MLLSDLQDPPELMGDMIAEWARGTPVVVGIKNTSEEKLAHVPNRSFYYSTIASLASLRLLEHFTGFGVYDRKVMDILRKDGPTK
jgi:hypothetical protein